MLSTFGRGTAVQGKCNVFRCEMAFGDVVVNVELEELTQPNPKGSTGADD